MPGEKVTLIGPSGSGKTTVLRLAMALEKPTSGDIRLFGESIIRDDRGLPRSSRDEARIRRRCGMVFQQFNLFPHMTVLDNLVLAPRTVLKLDKKKSEELAMEHLRLVGLSQKASAYPGQLSGGQQQRIAIARALALRPEILLLDEITSSLDPELAGEVLDVVRNVAHVMKITLLIVTHEMRFAREVSDRIAMFDGGRIVEQGTPEADFRKPAVRANEGVPAVRAQSLGSSHLGHASLRMQGDIAIITVETPGRLNAFTRAMRERNRPHSREDRKGPADRRCGRDRRRRCVLRRARTSTRRRNGMKPRPGWRSSNPSRAGSCSFASHWLPRSTASPPAEAFRWRSFATAGSGIPACGWGSLKSSGASLR